MTDSLSKLIDRRPDLDVERGVLDVFEDSDVDLTDVFKEMRNRHWSRSEIAMAPARPGTLNQQTE